MIQVLHVCGADQLNSEEGLDLFLAAMDEAFKPTSQCRVIKIYNNFYRDMHRKTDENRHNPQNTFNFKA